MTDYAEKAAALKIAALEGQLREAREIAEENEGEHIKLEQMREDVAGFVRRLVELELSWHQAAASVNQANSPSIYIECSDQLRAEIEAFPHCPQPMPELEDE